jgi:hypothetical protein
MRFLAFSQTKLGSSFLLRAYGWVGQAQHLLFILPSLFQYAPPKNLRAKPKQAGKKEGGLGEGIFARLLCRAKRGMGWEAACLCVSKEAKPAKISFSFNGRAQKIFLIKETIFAGFAYSAFGGVSRWAGLLKIRKRILFKESSNLV